MIKLICSNKPMQSVSIVPEIWVIFPGSPTGPWIILILFREKDNAYCWVWNKRALCALPGLSCQRTRGCLWDRHSTFASSLFPRLEAWDWGLSSACWWCSFPFVLGLSCLHVAVSFSFLLERTPVAGWKHANNIILFLWRFLNIFWDPGS